MAGKDNAQASVMSVAKRDFGDKYLWPCGISETVINQLKLKNRCPSPKLKWGSLRYLGPQGAKAWRNNWADWWAEGLRIQTFNNHQGSAFILLALVASSLFFCSSIYLSGILCSHKVKNQALGYKVDVNVRTTALLMASTQYSSNALLPSSHIYL